MTKIACIALALTALTGCVVTNGRTTGIVSDGWSIIATKDSEGRISAIHGEGPEGSGDWLPTKNVKGIASIKEGNRATVTIVPIYEE